MKTFTYSVGGLSENATPEEQTDVLKKMGKKGFELCSAFHMGRGKNSGYIFYYFKKELLPNNSNNKDNSNKDHEGNGKGKMGKAQG